MKHATIKRSVGCFALTWVLAMTTGPLAVRPVDAFARTDGKSSEESEPNGASRAADSVNAFASELLRAETTDGASPHNLVVSPWSIVGVLMMARAGAKARTAAEIDAMLHVTDPSSQYAQVHALDLALAARNHTNVDQHRPSSVQLATANRTYAQAGVQVAPTFSELLAQQFDADLGAVDFEHSPDQARATINAWVADRTQGQVRQLLTSADITRATRLVLVDAAYLHADWETPFDKALTLKRVFHSPNRDTTARFMHREAPMPYATGDGWQAVELPYSGNQLALDVILPDRGRFNQVMQAAPGMLSTCLTSRTTRWHSRSPRSI